MVRKPRDIHVKLTIGGTSHFQADPSDGGHGEVMLIHGSCLPSPVHTKPPIGLVGIFLFHIIGTYWDHLEG